MAGGARRLRHGEGPDGAERPRRPAAPDPHGGTVISAKLAPLALALLVPCSAVTAGDAPPAQEIVRAAVASRPAPWSATVELPRFDPRLGDLEAVTVAVTSRARGHLRAENEGAAAELVTAGWHARTRVHDDLGGALVAADPHGFADVALPAFDGVLDFRGRSGQATPLLATATEAATFTDAETLRRFAGAGRVVLPVEAAAFVVTAVDTPIRLELDVETTAVVVVTYRYRPRVGLGS